MVYRADCKQYGKDGWEFNGPDPNSGKISRIRSSGFAEGGLDLERVNYEKTVEFGDDNEEDNEEYIQQKVSALREGLHAVATGAFSHLSGIGIGGIGTFFGSGVFYEILGHSLGTLGAGIALGTGVPGLFVGGGALGAKLATMQSDESISKYKSTIEDLRKIQAEARALYGLPTDDNQQNDVVNQW